MGNIKNEQNCNVRCEKKSSSVQKKPVVGFLKWWLLITGLYSASAVCPFCGQAGCPVGLGSASIIGGFFAFWIQYARTIYQYPGKILFKQRK